MTPAQTTAVAAVVARRLEPPAPPEHLLDFARRFKFQEGDHKGAALIPESHPAQYFALRAIGDALLQRSIRRHFVFVKPTQDGGTLITHTIPQIYTAGVLLDPVICGFPDMRLSAAHWTAKLRPLVRQAAPDWLPLTGPGSEGASTPNTVALNGTSIYWIGGGASNEAGQASITGRLLTRDELDSMDRYVADLMVGRVDSFKKRGRHLVIDTSTIKHDERSPIEDSWQTGTAGRLWWACPVCGTFQVWDHQAFEFSRESDIEASRTARLRCRGECKQAIDDPQRETMLTLANCRLVMRGQTCTRDGQVEGPEPDTLTWALKWTGFDSPLISLASLAIDACQAEREYTAGDPDRLRRVHRDRYCTRFKDDRKPIVLTAAWIEKLSTSSSYAAGTVPAGVDLIVITVDVQLRWHYWWAEGFTPDRRRYLIAAGVDYLTQDDGRELLPDLEPSDLARYESMRRIDALAANGWPRAGDESVRVPALLRGVDVGFKQDVLRGFLVEYTTWNAVKGLGDDDAEEQIRARGDKLGRGRWHDARLERDARGEWELWFIDTALVKQVVQSGYLLPDGPGAARVPAGLKASGAVARHLVAERQVQLPSGRKVWQKVTSNAANHYLDCAVYASALARAYYDAQETVRQAQAQRAQPARTNPAPPREPLRDPPVARSGIAFNRRSSRLASRRLF